MDPAGTREEELRCVMGGESGAVDAAMQATMLCAVV